MCIFHDYEPKVIIPFSDVEKEIAKEFPNYKLIGSERNVTMRQIRIEKINSSKQYIIEFPNYMTCIDRCKKCGKISYQRLQHAINTIYELIFKVVEYDIQQEGFDNFNPIDQNWKKYVLIPKE